MSIIQRTSYSLVTPTTPHSIESIEPRSRIGSTILIENETIEKKKTDIKLASKTVTKKFLKKGPAKREKTSEATRTRVKKGPLKGAKSPRSKVLSRNNSPTIVKDGKSRGSSREASQRSSQKFNFRDRSSRSLLLDSPANRTSLFSLASDISLSSRLSTSSRRHKSRAIRSKSSITKTGYWGRHRIHLLKTEKPQEADDVQKDNSDADNTQIEFVESSESDSVEINTISDSDSRKALTSILSGSETETESTLSELECGLEEPEHDGQAERLNFLQIFGRLPDINLLSASGSAEIVEVPNQEGRFLPALDVGSYRSRETDSSTDLEVEEEYIENPDLRTFSSEISLGSLTDGDEEIEIVPQKIPDEDVSEYLLSIRPRTTIFSDTSPIDDEVSLANAEVIENFLIVIINEVVEYAERTSVRRGRVSRLLDKEKMLEELHHLVIDYQSELHRNHGLEKVTTEYYVRRKEFDLVIVPKQIDTIYRERLISAQVELDNRLEQMKQTEELCHKQIQDLTEELAVSRRLNAEKVTQFEAKVRETLCKEGCDHLKLVIEDLFRKMNTVRDEMSHMRGELIFIQHRLQALKNKSEKLENLGNGLRVLEYISNQGSNYALKQKLEDRDLELKRLRERQIHAFHAMAHWMNKKKMNEELLRKMKAKLKSQEQLKKDLRDSLFKERVQHKHLKKQTTKLKTAGCLMHYPDLLRDYDATESHLRTKRVLVRKLYIEHNRLEQKISEVDASIDRFTSALRSKHSFFFGSLRFSRQRRQS
ncbi:centrosomal protein of 135 kDa isoform X1 [Drosophila takahashii]|uniref:centrosomal protein of 135 kDa isoform X1 n=1 Tax=Drosophila takahashii TaxID=29030 RepID=UPI0038994547